MDEWKAELFVRLSDFMARRVPTSATEPDRLPPPPGPAGEPPVDGGSGEGPTPAQTAARAQLAAVLETARAATEGGGEAPSELEALRLFIASFRWAVSQQTGEVLDTHEANRAFRLREELELEPSETLELVRSMLTGRDARPGWHWLRKFDVPAFVLAYLVTSDRNSAVRVRALELLDPDTLDEDEDGRPALVRRRLPGSSRRF